MKSIKFKNKGNNFETKSARSAYLLNTVNTYVLVGIGELCEAMDWLVTATIVEDDWITGEVFVDDKNDSESELVAAETREREREMHVCNK